MAILAKRKAKCVGRPKSAKSTKWQYGGTTIATGGWVVWLEKTWIAGCKNKVRELIRECFPWDCYFKKKRGGVVIALLLTGGCFVVDVVAEVTGRLTSSLSRETKLDPCHWAAMFCSINQNCYRCCCLQALSLAFHQTQSQNIDALPPTRSKISPFDLRNAVPHTQSPNVYLAIRSSPVYSNPKWKSVQSSLAMVSSLTIKHWCSFQTSWSNYKSCLPSDFTFLTLSLRTILSDVE